MTVILEKNFASKRVGNPFNLPKESEDQIVECLTVMAKWGFGLTPSEVCEYVKEYVTEKKKENYFLCEVLEYRLK